jgi:peptidoglycan-associated lipoprotein
MNRTNLHRFENLIMITFPIVLFAGCAGSDIKPVVAEKPVATYVTYVNPLPEPDLLEISTVMPSPDETDPSIRDDNQQEISRLSTEERPPIDTTSDGTSTVLPTPATSILYFDTDKHQLRTEQHEALKQHADFLIANPHITLVINGHADKRGTEPYNQTLSEKRAQSVYDLLIALGVPQTQLTRMGFGELQPLQDENQWDENRRVELEYENPVMLSSRQ